MGSDVMTYKKYIYWIAAVAVVGWMSMFLVVSKLDPCTGPGDLFFCAATSASSVILFFLSLFFALTATFSLFGFGIRIWLHKYEIYLDHLNVSIRQGIMLSLCALGCLGLLLLNALTWWSGFLLLAIIILLELYFART